MTQPTPEGIPADANDVLDELVAHIGRLAKENAIFRAQLKAISSPAHTMTESETQPQ